MENQPSTVVVAMSGGVDSSVAAALLKEAGWKVHGVHLLLPADPSITAARLESVTRVSERLGIPIETVDLIAPFERGIVAPFINAYQRGLTPNPCVVCNAHIKFEYLRRHAERTGLQHLATGHYARVVRKGAESPVALSRGRDRRKEQSYFLHRISQACLSRAVFPLGEMTKNETRKRAGEAGLSPQSMSESQEICFLGQKDYRTMVARDEGSREPEGGDIIDEQGRILGQHGGIYRYTVGQRQGLGIASSRPYYVKDLRPETNQVVVARREALYTSRVKAVQFHWTSGVPDKKVMRVEAQVRYRHRAASGRLEVVSSGSVTFDFEKPQWAVTPGQALVCYDGDRVLGGGWIARTGNSQSEMQVN